jgi:hypothetical protein
VVKKEFYEPKAKGKIAEYLTLPLAATFDFIGCHPRLLQFFRRKCHGESSRQNNPSSTFLPDGRYKCRILREISLIKIILPCNETLDRLPSL